MTGVQKSELKNDWNDSLFFNANDIRFEGKRCSYLYYHSFRSNNMANLFSFFLIIADGRKFFSKESKADSEFSTLRRNLRQIVRTKVQKNLRKKVTWKKNKQYKS